MQKTSCDQYEKALEVISEELVSAKELAEILDVSKSSVCEWSLQKRFDSRAVLEIGSTRRYVLSRVLRSLHNNYVSRHKR